MAKASVSALRLLLLVGWGSGLLGLEQLVNSEQAAYAVLSVKLFHFLEHMQRQLHFRHLVWIRSNWGHSGQTPSFFESVVGKSYFAPSMVLNGDAALNWTQVNHLGPSLVVGCGRWLMEALRRESADRTLPREYMLMWVVEEEELKQLCVALGVHKSVRPLLIDRQSVERQLFLTCDGDHVKKWPFTAVRHLYHYGHSEMKGLDIITEADQLPPRSILYHGGNGALQMEGFVGNCITTFAERHGANLLITPPEQLGRVTHYDALANKTFMGLIDLPAIVTPIKITADQWTRYSYPLELMDYCYMIPLPRLVDTSEVFTYIVEPQVMAVVVALPFVYGLLFTIATQRNGRGPQTSCTNLLLNDKAVRVLLGQAFVMSAKPSLLMRYLCLLLCYTSLLVNTTYEAYLQSHLIHPSVGKRAETYREIRAAGLSIAISAQELHFVTPSVYQKYPTLFHVMPSFDAFIELRASLDLGFAYPVSNTRWQVFKQQQRLFKRPLFFYSERLCLQKHVPLGVPLRPRLPYSSLFDQHLLEIRDSGLLQYWINNNFDVMVRLRYLRFEDVSTPEEYADAIEVRDLMWIWIMYGGFVGAASALLALELIYNRIA